MTQDDVRVGMAYYNVNQTQLAKKIGISRQWLNIKLNEGDSAMISKAIGGLNNFTIKSLKYNEKIDGDLMRLELKGLKVGMALRNISIHELQDEARNKGIRVSMWRILSGDGTSFSNAISIANILKVPVEALVNGYYI